MKLFLRFSLVIGGVVFFVFSVFFFSLFFVEKNYLQQQGEQARWDDMHRFSLVCQESILSADEIVLMNYIRGLKKSQEVLWAFFLDKDQQIVTHSDVRLKGQKLKNEDFLKDLGKGISRSFVREGKSVLEYAMPVQTGNGVIGEVRIAYDMNHISRHVRLALQDIAKRYFGVSLICFVLGILLAAMAARNLSHPIQQLINGIQRTSQGDRNAFIPSDRQDEIGELAQEFNHMVVKLGELDQLKDGFIHTVSHDLRNPLSAISMSSKMLLSGDYDPVTDNQKQVVNIILSSADRLRTMVNNILDLAKMREKGLSYDKNPLSPKKIMQDIAGLYHAFSCEKGVELTVDCPSDVPMIEADEEKLHRIFTNLVSNAIKFTRRGGTICLGAGHVRGSGEVEFFVRDSGIGISPEALPGLFTKFSSVSSIDPHFKPLQGTGLGLVIVKALVEGHGGQIRVSSEMKKGTTFYWTIPVSG